MNEYEDKDYCPECELYTMISDPEEVKETWYCPVCETFKVIEVEE